VRKLAVASGLCSSKMTVRRIGEILKKTYPIETIENLRHCACHAPDLAVLAGSPQPVNKDAHCPGLRMES